MSEHLDLDALADVLAGEPEPEHLSGCTPCRARLDELAAALPLVSSALAAAPVPQMPADLPDRLASLGGEATTATADVLPIAGRRVRWLPALASVAAAAVVVTGGVVLLQRDDPARDSATSAAGDTGGTGYAVNVTGTNYTRTGQELQAALPALLTGTAAKTALEAAPPPRAPGPSASASRTTAQKDTALSGSGGSSADPLAALRTTTGLARCLASLTEPTDSGVPLALDYASFEGRPALVVVLPTRVAEQVDVFVVPPGCAQADGNVLYFRRLQRP